MNNIDGTVEVIDFSLIDSLAITPQIDESGDDDGDGLTNFEELMIWGTDPRKMDTDGMGSMIRGKLVLIRMCGVLSLRIYPCFLSKC